MKKTVLVFSLVALFLLGCLSGCTAAPAANDSSSGSSSSSSEEDVNMITGTLYAVLSKGNIKETDFGYEDGKLTVLQVANALSEWTGLNFAVTSSMNDDGSIVIDWSANSTLVAGLGNTEQKDEFFMHDVDTLSWFMMNSLCKSVRDNMDGVDVFYSMNGGEPLDLPEVPGASFSPGVAYNRANNESIIV